MNMLNRASVQQFTIELQVNFQLETDNLALSVQVDPDIPFDVLMDGIYQQAFSEELYSIFQGTLQFKLDERAVDKNEKRSLNQLGAQNRSKLLATLKTKPNQLLKVTVKYCLPQDLNLQMNDILQDVKNKIFQEDVDVYDCKVSLNMKMDGYQ